VHIKGDSKIGSVRGNNGKFAQGTRSREIILISKKKERKRKDQNIGSIALFPRGV